MSKRLFVKRWLRAALVLIAVVALLGGAVLTVFLKPYRDQARAFDLDELALAPAIDYQRLPDHLVDAIVAAEDHRFFRHGGLDVKGICRAALVNWQSDRIVQGASTISQQLARQSYGILEKTMKRKLVEAFLVLRVEEAFSKEAILSKYLSRIYFGGGYHGIESAAWGYFEKSVEDLSVGEAAMLAGIIKAPSVLEPRKNPDGAFSARNTVLAQMVEQGFLDANEATRWQGEPLLPNR